MNNESSIYVTEFCQSNQSGELLNINFKKSSHPTTFS